MLLNNIMVDLETFSTEPNALIVSLGAVKFDQLGPKETTLIRFNIAEQHGMGRDVSMSTIEWWMSQGDQARSDLFGPDTVLAGQGLMQLALFMGKDPVFWASPSGFDEPILKTLFTALSMKTPWHYRQVRDLRTLKARHGKNWVKSELEITAHNPVDDCLHQIDELLLNEGGTEPLFNSEV